MSGALERLIDALEAQTAALNKMIEMSGTKGGSAKAESRTPAPTTKPVAKAATKKKTTLDDIAEKFGSYLGVKDKEERETRKSNVKTILEYFSVARASDLKPSDFDEALGYLQQYLDGETPDFDGAEDGEDDALV
jgi:hypothetical protein